MPHLEEQYQKWKLKSHKLNTKPNNQMKKILLFIAMLFAGMLIAGTIDEQTRQLEQQPNTINK